MGSFLTQAGIGVSVAQAVTDLIYRPSLWNQPAETMITVPATSQPGTSSPGLNTSGTALPGAAGKPEQNYVFDAILRVEHERQLRITEHPVQSGASISDHAYQLPARVALEIGMSDAMDSYNPNQWTGGTSKSVNAYQTLVDLQEQRTPFTLVTRLATYQNMLIESIRPIDTDKTKYGLRATVVFQQIFFATVEDVSSQVVFDKSAAPIVSARPQSTSSTIIGAIQGTTPSQALFSQHNIETAAQFVPAALKAAKIPGAGLWSSANVSLLQNLIK